MPEEQNLSPPAPPQAQPQPQLTEEEKLNQMTPEQLEQVQTEEIFRMNNDGYFRFQLLTVLSKIDMNLETISKKLNGIGIVLSKMGETFEEDETKQDGTESALPEKKA